MGDDHELSLGLKATPNNDVGGFLDLLLQGMGTFQGDNHELILKGYQHQLLVPPHELNLRVHGEDTFLLKKLLLPRVRLLAVLVHTHYVGVVDTIHHFSQLTELGTGEGGFVSLLFDLLLGFLGLFFFEVVEEAFLFQGLFLDLGAVGQWDFSSLGREESEGELLVVLFVGGWGFSFWFVVLDAVRGVIEVYVLRRWGASS